MPSSASPGPAGRSAVTAYRVLDAVDTNALVELRPKQGRMHQVRVHLLFIGTPILGDPLYDERSPAETTPIPFLRATRLEWREPPGMPPGTVWSWTVSWATGKPDIMPA